MTQQLGLAAMVSGRLLSLKIPWGSLLAWILARAKERQMTSLNKLCLIYFLQTIKTMVASSVYKPAARTCVRMANCCTPNLIRVVSSSRCNPQFEIGITWSQAPACSDWWNLAFWVVVMNEATRSDLVWRTTASSHYLFGVKPCWGFRYGGNYRVHLWYPTGNWVLGILLKFE